METVADILEDTFNSIATRSNFAILSSRGKEAQKLIQIHNNMGSRQNTKTMGCSTIDSPIYVHFHNFPIFVVTVMVVDEFNLEDDTIYLHKIQRFNNKVCEDNSMKVTCCSFGDYDSLRFCGIEVQSVWQKNIQNETMQESSRGLPFEISSSEITQILLNQTFNSVLSVNELLVCRVRDVSLVCRLSGVILGEENTSNHSRDAALEDPYRGIVGIDTEFCVSAAPCLDNGIKVKGESLLPESGLPEDVIHVSTNDLEWFPVRRSLLVPCIKLTQYIQHGRGKYKDNILPLLSDGERSPDAPTNDGCPHVAVPMDCCIFDRVLLFLISLLYPNERSMFLPDPSEIHELVGAADALGLQALADLCSNKVLSFDSRVRKNSYYRFAEVEQRNTAGKELLLILDGMVLDITQWLDQHPGGPSIIPYQALNIDCTVFFEMYHVSRQSFRYLKGFYIGELDPCDIPGLKSSADGVMASAAFLESLRTYTSSWRVKIDDKMSAVIHKSF